MLELVTLNSLEVRYRGVRLGLPVKAALLVTILAHTSRRVMPRATLADLLWPKTSKGLHSLDQTIYILRRQIGANGLQVSEGDVALRVFATSDYLQLLDSLKAGDVMGACHQTRGAFLQSVRISCSETFEEWRDRHQAYLASALHNALMSSIKSHRELGAWREVVALGVEGIRLFPSSWEMRLAAVDGKI